MYFRYEFWFAFFMLFVFPIPIFMLVPLKVLHWLYIGVVAIFFGTALWVTTEAYTGFFTRRKYTPALNCKKKCTLIVPAYFNNECEILHESMDAYTKIEYSGPITVMLVFNTGPGGDFSQQENEIISGWDNHVVGNIRFRVLKNMNSRSKAENVNYALSLIDDTCDYIAVYDADHQPYVDSVSYAMATFEQEKCQIIQGHCIIRNVFDAFLPGLIAAEFEDMYNVGHEGRTTLFDLGLFGGSNGYWEADLLKEIQMDGSMLTEDIDSSFRATVRGVKISYGWMVRSTELAPMQFMTMLNQRLRWAQGWFQVSMKYFMPTMRCKHLNLRQKAGCALLLCWREIFVYFTFNTIQCMVVFVIRTHVFYIDRTLLILSIFVLSLGWAKLALNFFAADGIVDKQRRSFLWVYFLLYPFWAGLLNMVQVAAHGRQLFKMDAWVATKRERKDKATGAVVPIVAPEAQRLYSVDLPPSYDPESEGLSPGQFSKDEFRRRSGVGFLYKPATPRETPRNVSRRSSGFSVNSAGEVLATSFRRLSVGAFGGRKDSRGGGGGGSASLGSRAAMRTTSGPPAGLLDSAETGDSLRPRRRIAGETPGTAASGSSAGFRATPGSGRGRTPFGATPTGAELESPAGAGAHRRPSFISNLFNARGNDAAQPRMDVGMTNWIDDMCNAIVSTDTGGIHAAPLSTSPDTGRSEISAASDDPFTEERAAPGGVARMRSGGSHHYNIPETIDESTEPKGSSVSTLHTVRLSDGSSAGYRREESDEENASLLPGRGRR